MKYLQTSIWLWLFSLISYGQIIHINDVTYPESKYDIVRLVNEVLISSNACSPTSNFTFQVKGQPKELTTKSYGYFKTPAGSNFPFKEGIVLTTGHAYPAGNNTNDITVTHQNHLSGDSDLEAALSITNTYDATLVKFNFVPQKNTIRFRFIMGSEEYNNDFQCKFTDSFAFLLREVGTQNYLNLAVLPDGTPVSVRNINNSNKCRKNPNYFDTYNPSSSNYGGHTKVLIAQSAVTDGKTYEIKLVIADQEDKALDSAIFLEAGSFDLGGDLGPDRTIANGNPGCTGSPITLDSKITLKGLTFKWYKNNVEIPGETNSTLKVTSDGIYKFELTSAVSCTATDEVVIEFAKTPIIDQETENLQMCDMDDDFKEEFDFSSNEALVLGTQNPNNFIFTYHKTQADAEANLNALTVPYTNVQLNEIIWLRIADTTQTCYKVTSFKINVKQQPKFTSLEDYYICGNVSNATFDLTRMNSQIQTGQSEKLHISYHLTKQHAEDNIPIVNETSFEADTNPQTIYVRFHFDPNKNGILDSNECSRTDMKFRLIKSNILEDMESEFLFPEFISPNKVKVTVKGEGDHEFSLNNGTWQKENIFNNLSYGAHILSVRDLLGCGIKTIKIVNIDYPKYFTPNGDGYHDTWNISSLKSQANAKIYIFDRYGKLLKELSPASIGWNGTFNGRPMPTADYWFKVEYMSPTTNKIEQFRANFTLKR